MNMPMKVTETPGSGLRGIVDGRQVTTGSRDFIFMK
jgi:hypothetical protein